MSKQHVKQKSNNQNNPFMKKIAILTIIFYLVQHTIMAQKNFVSGYIVKESGDTVRGKIDDKEWSKSPAKILFLANDGQSKTYNIVNELQGFGIDNKSIYIRKKTSLDVTPHSYNDLLTTNNRMVVEDTTLALKVMVKGKISLYFFHDNNGKEHYFVEKLGEPITELINHEYMMYRSETSEQKVLVKDDMFNNQLSDLCEDCSLFNKKKFAYNYTESTLKSVVLEYNSFFGDKEAKITTKKEKFSNQFFFQIGAGQYSYRTDNFESNSNYFSPAIGLGWLLELPSERRKVALKFDATLTVFSETQRYSAALIDKSSSYFGVAFSPQYSLYRNKETKRNAYLTAGLSWEIPLNNTESTYPLYPRNYTMLGYKGGIGLRFNKFNLECSYLETTTQRQITFNANSLYRFMLTVGYALF